MCEVQRCFGGDCDGSWDCTRHAVVEVAYLVAGGFGGRLRVKRQKKCGRCFLQWCRNRRRKRRDIPPLVAQEEKYWLATLGGHGQALS